MSKNTLTALLFAAVIFLGFYSMYRVIQPRILSSEEMKVNGFFEYGVYAKLRDFELIDDSGNSFTNKNLKEKKLNFLYFGYTTCPAECPVMMSVMRQIYDQIDTDDIQFYLISFDPEIDTSDRLKGYVSGYNKDFIGITGELSEVVKLGWQLGVEKLEPMQNHNKIREISHTNHLIVVNQDAEVIGIFREPFESTRMALVIKSLLRSN